MMNKNKSKGDAKNKIIIKEKNVSKSNLQKGLLILSSFSKCLNFINNFLLGFLYGKVNDILKTIIYLRHT